MVSSLHPSHLLILQDDTGRRPFVLQDAVYQIGRDAECEICLVSQFVSRYHAVLRSHRQADGQWRYCLEDGDLQGRKSANGFLINGHKRRTHTLADQDVVTFGPGVTMVYYALQLLDAQDVDGSAPTAPHDVTPMM
jgi:pSer/pThr/pTyr-binding forkhead associated (FHA) protein